jgi:fructosamine-3-kinase
VSLTLASGAPPGADWAVVDHGMRAVLTEADLSMMYCAGGPPALGRFFDAYHAVAPPEPGWRDRMHLLHLRELLSDLAHFGVRASSAAEVQRIIRPFRKR